MISHTFASFECPCRAECFIYRQKAFFSNYWPLITRMRQQETWHLGNGYNCHSSYALISFTTFSISSFCSFSIHDSSAHIWLEGSKCHPCVNSKQVNAFFRCKRNSVIPAVGKSILLKFGPFTLTVGDSSKRRGARQTFDDFSINFAAHINLRDLLWRRLNTVLQAVIFWWL